MTRIEQPHHSIRWRRGEPSIEWGHAQVLARSSGARAARVRPRGRRQRTVLCHTSHARNAFHIVHHHPWSTLPAAGSWLSAPGSSTVPTCDDRGYEYEPDPEAETPRAAAGRGRTSGLRPVCHRCTVSVWPRPSVPRGCAGVRGARIGRGTRGRDRSPNRPDSRPRLVRLAAVLYVKTYITSREDWEVVGLVIWRYRISHYD